MPKYLVKTPEGKYAEWSTITDSFTDLYTVMEVDLKNMRPKSISSHYTWGSCVRFMVIRHGLDQTLAAIDEILSYTAQVWRDYARAIKLNPDTAHCPDFRDIPHPLPPSRTAKVLYLAQADQETQTYEINRLGKEHDLSRVTFIRCPEYAEEHYEKSYTMDQWFRECMALIDMCDCVYLDNHRRIGRSYMDLASYAQAHGKMVYTEDVLKDMIAYY